MINEMEKVIQSGQSDQSGQVDQPCVKHDEGKQKWHALPLELLAPLAAVMEAGARGKYKKFSCLGPYNNADPDADFWDANMRHAVSCQQNPLAIDEETGCYHEACRAFNSLMRIYHCQKLKEQLIKEGKEALFHEFHKNTVTTSPHAARITAPFYSTFRTLSDEGDDCR